MRFGMLDSSSFPVLWRCESTVSLISYMQYWSLITKYQLSWRHGCIMPNESFVCTSLSQFMALMYRSFFRAIGWWSELLVQKHAYWVKLLLLITCEKITSLRYLQSDFPTSNLLVIRFEVSTCSWCRTSFLNDWVALVSGWRRYRVVVSGTERSGVGSGLRNECRCGPGDSYWGTSASPCNVTWNSVCFLFLFWNSVGLFNWDNGVTANWPYSIQ